MFLIDDLSFQSKTLNPVSFVNLNIKSILQSEINEQLSADKPEQPLHRGRDDAER